MPLRTGYRKLQIALHWIVAVFGRALVIIAAGHALVATTRRVMWNDCTQDCMFRPNME